MTMEPLTPMAAGTTHERIIVEFEKKFDKWNPGEMAGFAEPRAMELIKAGVAKMVKRSGETVGKPGSGGMVDKQTTVGPQSRPPVQK